MQWSNLLTYLSGKDSFLVGIGTSYYGGNMYEGVMHSPFSSDSILSIDYGCGPDPIMNYVEAGDSVYHWRFGNSTYTAPDYPVVLINNSYPDDGSYPDRHFLIPSELLAGVSAIRVKAELLGTWSNDNYRSVHIPIRWVDVESDDFYGTEIGAIEHPSYFNNLDETDWVVVDISSLPATGHALAIGLRGYGCSGSFGHFALHLEMGHSPPPPPRKHYRVYEIDKGWSFDGMYIPHFLEMNWYFGDDPFTDKTIQKVRVHGMAKGRTQLQLAVAGMQHEYDSDYTEPQFIDLPRNAAFISTDYIPTTNYVDSSNWGVSLQLKFEGRNCDLMRPEPSHVLQVLALQGSPQENGKRIN